VSIFQGTKSLGVFLLGLEQIFIPLLVELLVLLDMGLLALLLLLGLVENQFLEFLLIILLFELLKPLLCHLGFNILAFGLTVVSMLVQYLPIRRYKMGSINMNV
jgi:apolipoprotein N-acyltransferase